MSLLFAMPVLFAAGEPALCARPEGAVAAIWWIGPREVRQGASVPLNPLWTYRPGAFDSIPEGCVTGLSSSAPEHVLIAKDGRSASVGADAPPGLIVKLKGRIGDDVIQGDIRVTGAGEGPLAGTRHQTAAACDDGGEPSTPVGELKLTASGAFDVTWQPFEAYRDYWGTYAYDAATHRLVLTVTGGNHVPEGLDLEGEARLQTDGSLALSGFWLGQPQPGAARACVYTFKK